MVIFPMVCVASLKRKAKCLGIIRRGFNLEDSVPCRTYQEAKKMGKPMKGSSPIELGMYLRCGGSRLDNHLSQ